MTFVTINESPSTFCVYFHEKLDVYHHHYHTYEYIPYVLSKLDGSFYIIANPIFRCKVIHDDEDTAHNGRAGLRSRHRSAH